MYPDVKSCKPENAFSGIPFKLPLPISMKESYKRMMAATKVFK